MWEFMKYCIYCLMATICASFDQNSDGFDFIITLVGIFTIMFLLGFLYNIAHYIFDIKKKKIIYENKNIQFQYNLIRKK